MTPVSGLIQKCVNCRRSLNVFLKKVHLLFLIRVWGVGGGLLMHRVTAIPQRRMNIRVF